jgi:peptidoglycan/LPS O-acetylase OafA/YrhL
VASAQRSRHLPGASGTPAPRDNQSLNALRTLAAVAVLVHHLKPMLMRADFLPGLGHDAVIVFFVLSGYWVGGGVLRSVGRSRFDWRDYAVKRLARLWIVLLPALILTAALDLTGRAWFTASTVYTDPWFYPHGYLELGTPLSVKAALGNVAFLQAIHVPPFGTNGPLWSLAFEFWYYTMFPLAVLVLRRSSARRTRLACAAGFLGCCAIAPDVLKSFPLWLLGALVARQQPSVQAMLRSLTRSQLTAIRAVMTAGLAAAVLCWSVFPGFIHWYVGEAAVAVAAACLLAVLLDDVDWRGIPGRLLRGLSGYARASYSLYAVHLPILAFVTAAVIGRPERRWQLGPDVLAASAFIALAVVLAAWGFASFTEMHTDTIRKALLPGRHSIGRPAVRS